MSKITDFRERHLIKQGLIYISHRDTVLSATTIGQYLLLHETIIIAIGLFVFVQAMVFMDQIATAIPMLIRRARQNGHTPSRRLWIRAVCSARILLQHIETSLRISTTTTSCLMPAYGRFATRTQLPSTTLRNTLTATIIDINTISACSLLAVLSKRRLMALMSTISLMWAKPSW